MSKIISALLILVICLFPAPALASGTEVTSNDLIDQAREYDSREVIYTGEVIGDIMARGDHAWINVSDGSNAIGIWVKTADMQGIDTAGRYNMHGDTIKVTGVFHRACAEHGGDFDIHADKLELVEKGYAVAHPADPVKTVVACVLFAAAISIALIVKTKTHTLRQ